MATVKKALKSLSNRFIMNWILSGCFLLNLNFTQGQPISVHDPVMIKEGSTYHVFCTGFGIGHYSSTDLKHWVKHRPVFSKPPDWASAAVKGLKGGSLWAPDIHYYKGRYYLYYSVSAFGKNTSCIGLAVNKTLDSTDADFKWTDLGKVVQSIPGRDFWNAIDPNLILDRDSIPWLAFGSFWGGVKMVKLENDLKTIAKPEVWQTIASRPRTASLPDTIAGDAAIEAPFIYKKGDYYYLLVSWDYCCRGVNSTYKVVIGRSKEVTGPYLDKSGKRMSDGGGSLLMEGDADWYGVGHAAAYTIEGKDLFICHGYDAKDQGKSKLLLKEMFWDEWDWPILKDLF